MGQVEWTRLLAARRPINSVGLPHELIVTRPMDASSTQRVLQDYANRWSFALPEPLVFTPVRKWFRTVAFRAHHESDPIRQFAYLERDSAVPWAFHFPPLDSDVDMLPLWAAYPTVSAFDINWRMGMGEDYKIQWWEWLDALEPDELEEYKARFPPPDDDRGWALCFWDVDDSLEDEDM